MFLFHINHADDFVLDFIKSYNKSSSFDFTTYIVVENNVRLIEALKDRDYNKSNVYIYVYYNMEQFYQYISSIPLKYIFYSCVYHEVWTKINFFHKYIMYFDKNNEIVSKIENHKLYFSSSTEYKKEKQNFELSPNLSEEELHTFFRAIINDFPSTCAVNDTDMILYAGTNSMPAAAYETKTLTIKQQEEVKTEKPVTSKETQVTQNTQQTVKTVNKIYKNSSSIAKKNINNDIINICIIGDWIKSEDLQKLWCRYCKEENRWDNLRLVDESCNDIDYYVIINRANFSGDVSIPSDKCIVFHMEPNMEFVPWYREFVTYFNSNDLLFNGKHIYHMNNIDWHLSLSYSQWFNTNIVKTKDDKISMVMSNRQDNIGHVMRLKLAGEIDRSSEIKCDIFGKCKDLGFRNYQKELPYYSRDEALIPYKYHFMAENTSINNYFTEKIVDCILSETLCFYWGCPTLDRFINPQCFIRLPLHDTKRSLEIIRESIINDEWSKRIDLIRIEKNKILKQYSLMPRVKNILRLNIDTQILLYTNKDMKEINDTVNVMSQQSFKNISYKRSENENYDTTQFIELMYYVNQVNKSVYFMNHKNCMKNGKIDDLLYDKVCATLGTIYNIYEQQNIKDNIVFMFSDKNDINNIFEQDIYITPEVANKVLDTLKNNTISNMVELFNIVPIFRLRYIF